MTETGLVPLMMKDNRWAVKELEYDLVTVLQLTNETIAFNLEELQSFFDAEASKQSLGKLSIASKTV
jgi:hypothetical protein